MEKYKFLLKIFDAYKNLETKQKSGIKSISYMVAVISLMLAIQQFMDYYQKKITDDVLMISKTMYIKINNDMTMMEYNMGSYFVDNLMLQKYRLLSEINYLKATGKKVPDYKLQNLKILDDQINEAKKKWYAIIENKRINNEVLR